MPFKILGEKTFRNQNYTNRIQKFNRKQKDGKYLRKIKNITG